MYHHHKKIRVHQSRTSKPGINFRKNGGRVLLTSAMVMPYWGFKA